MHTTSKRDWRFCCQSSCKENGGYKKGVKNKNTKIFLACGKGNFYLSTKILYVKLQMVRIYTRRRIILLQKSCVPLYTIRIYCSHVILNLMRLGLKRQLLCQKLVGKDLAILRSYTVETFLERAGKYIKHCIENNGKKMMSKDGEKQGSFNGCKSVIQRGKKLIVQGENLTMCIFSLTHNKQYKKQRKEETIKSALILQLYKKIQQRERVEFQSFHIEKV